MFDLGFHNPYPSLHFPSPSLPSATNIPRNRVEIKEVLSHVMGRFLGTKIAHSIDRLFGRKITPLIDWLFGGKISPMIDWLFSRKTAPLINWLFTANINIYFCVSSIVWLLGDLPLHTWSFGCSLYKTRGPVWMPHLNGELILFKFNYFTFYFFFFL